MLFLSQHIGCTPEGAPLNPIDGISQDAHLTPCLNLQSYEWFIHLDVQAYFFRSNLYYLLARLARKHERDWLTVTDEKVRCD